MIEVNACNAQIVPSLLEEILFKLREQEVASAEMSPEQLDALENVGLKVTSEIKQQSDDNIERLTRRTPRTLGGIPLIINRQCPVTEIRFKDAAGNVIGVIKNLAIPVTAA